MRKWSIRLRMTIWVSVALIFMMVVMLAVFRIASVTVLQKTIRSYLIGAVESNTDKIQYMSRSERENYQGQGVLFIQYDDGYLAVDDDFLDSMNDVESALYTEDGTLLYGRNPFAKEMEGESFIDPRIYERRFDNDIYYIYDRRLIGESLDGLWIRGVVPFTRARRELSDIMKILLVFLPVLTLIAVVGGYLTTDKMLRPLRQIEQTVSEITGEEGLDKRIPVGEQEDELHTLSVAYNEMLDRLENAFEKEKQFTSDASHELRTPMSVIMAQTEYTLEKERDAEEYKEALHVIRRQGSRMTALIEDMLTYTRLEQSSERFPMEDVELSKLVSDICDDMRLLNIKDITLSSDVEQGIVLHGNQLLLSRLVQNLIDNAYKYGNENGNVWVSLKYIGASDNRKICLAVRDDGIGIAKEEQDKIFDRFFRSDRSRTRSPQAVKGNGLGLSIVKKIADYHGGVISVESSLGDGSTFTILFEL